MKELIYNVYIEDVNHNCFEIYNIFDHYSFVKDTQMNIKQNKENQSKFNEQLKSDIMYYGMVYSRPAGGRIYGYTVR